jgi:hypothetical protein
MKRRSARNLGRVLALLLILLVLPSTAHSQNEGTPAGSLDAFRRAVDEAYTLLQTEPPRLDEARQQLSALTNVELESGENVFVAPLLGSQDATIDVEAARLRLQSVAAQLDAAATDHTAARLVVLEEVLASPALQRRESLLDQLRRWLSNLFNQWATNAQPGAAPGPIGRTAAQVAGWVVIGVAAALLLSLLVRWLQTVLRSFVGEASRARENDDSLPATPAEARQAANRFAQGGDYRSAVRHLYLAALLTLQERRAVPRDASLTNREVLARTPENHPLHEPLQSVVEVFDDVWYGMHEPDAATFERYQVAVDELERNAPASTTTKATEPSR